MTAVVVGVLRETNGERRVALDPTAVGTLVGHDRVVLVENGAGLAAGFADADYVSGGAVVASRKHVLNECDVLAVVRCPQESLVEKMHAGQLLIGLLDPFNHLALVRNLADAGVTAVAFELLPRTLSSQSTAAGYRAAIVAAEAFGRYFSMMITASGTATPAKVIVVGAGVAGLQAMATARRLGAVVTGYDVRAASRREVESRGAAFLTSSVAQDGDAGGYATALSPAEHATQQAELASALSSFDVLITTAKVPGHAAPVLVSAKTLATLRDGSVCIDLGSSDLGGNVSGSVEGKRTVTPGGVTVIGAGELASTLPTSSSLMYARNVTAVIASLMPEDKLVIDPTDEIHSSIVVTHAGFVCNTAVRAALVTVPAPGSSMTEAKSAS